MNQARKNILFGIVHESLWGASFALINPMTILPLALKDLGGGAEQAGFMVALLFGGLNLPQLFAALYLSPKWSDPSWCAVLHAPAIACVALMSGLFYFFPEMDKGLKLTLFLGLSASFFLFLGLVVPHWVTLMSRSVPEEVRGRYFAWCFSLANLAGIASGYWGAQWCERGGLEWGFAACFALALPLQLASVSLFLLIRPLNSRPRVPGRLKPFLRAQWEHMSGSREVRMFLGIFVLMQLSSSVTGLFTVYLKERGVATSWFGLYNGAMNFGGLLGSFLMGYLADHQGPRAGLKWGFLIFGACLLTLPFPLPPAAGAAAYFGSGFFNSAYPVLNLYLLMRLARPGGTTEFAGAFATLTTPVVFLAPLLAGWLAGSTSYMMAFGLSLAAIGAGLLALKRLPEFGRKAEGKPA